MTFCVQIFFIDASLRVIFLRFIHIVPCIIFKQQKIRENILKEARLEKNVFPVEEQG